MSLMLLLSSSGIAYAQHFCGEDEMISKITLGEKHLSCGMVVDIQGCDDSEGAHDCCDNEYTKVDTDDRFDKADSEIDLNVDFLGAFTAVFVFQKIERFSSNNSYFKDYRPPPAERDLQVLYETFLI